MKPVIVISGGGDGLGRELAAALSPQNQVVVLSRSEEKLKKIADHFKCDYQVCDVTDYSSIILAVTNIIQKYHRLDVLINCAGIYITGRLDLNRPDLIEDVIKTNTLGTMLMTRAVLPQMRQQKSGTIINVISQGGLTVKAGASVYRASKWALVGFTKCLQLELSRLKIRVVGLYPGVMKTKFISKAGSRRSGKIALDLEEVVKSVEFILSLKKTTIIPELGIKDIHNYPR